MDIQTDCLHDIVGWRDTANECIDLDLAGFANYNTLPVLYWNDVPGMSLTNLYLATLNRDGSTDAATFLQFLENHRQDSIRQVLIDFQRKFQQQVRASTVISHEDLGYNIDGRKVVAKADRFVFFSIKPRSNLKEKIIIHGFSLKTETTQVIDIYLYSTSQLEPIAIIPYTTNTELDLQQVIDHRTMMLHSNSAYYIGYYETDLTGANQAYDTKSGCQSCNKTADKSQSLQYAKIDTGWVLAGGTYVDRTLPDVDDTSCFPGLNYESFGMNLRLSVACDLVPLICDHKVQLAPMVQLKGAIQGFWHIFNSNSVDSTIVNIKERSQIMAEKLAIDYDKELKRLSVDWTGLDCFCFSGRNTLNKLSLIRR